MRKGSGVSPPPNAPACPLRAPPRLTGPEFVGAGCSHAPPFAAPGSPFWAQSPPSCHSRTSLGSPRCPCPAPAPWAGSSGTAEGEFGEQGAFVLAPHWLLLDRVLYCELLPRGGGLLWGRGGRGCAAVLGLSRLLYAPGAGTGRLWVGAGWARPPQAGCWVATSDSTPQPAPKRAHAGGLSVQGPPGLPWANLGCMGGVSSRSRGRRPHPQVTHP